MNIAEIHQLREERLKHYDKDWCWQYDIRINNLSRDIQESNLPREELLNLTIKDFDFNVVTSKEDKARCNQFIQRHEWLATLSQFPTHWFTVSYKGILAGVLIMNMPNAFSKSLGEDTKTMERLISRGACVSWSPKNLASNLIMRSIRWMVKNTRYRLFTAYSDPQAKEIGTIYQACNFKYLGQKFGGTKQYKNPYTQRWVTDRAFRARSFYKHYARELGIEWQKEWNKDHKIFWNLMPDGVEEALRQMSKDKLAQAEFRIIPKKHKYAYILGTDKRETKKLLKTFLSNTRVFPYPKR